MARETSACPHYVSIYNLLRITRQEWQRSCPKPAGTGQACCVHRNGLAAAAPAPGSRHPGMEGVAATDRPVRQEHSAASTPAKGQPLQYAAFSLRVCSPSPRTGGAAAELCQAPPPLPRHGCSRSCGSWWRERKPRCPARPGSRCYRSRAQRAVP